MSSRRLAGLTLALGLMVSGAVGTAGAQEVPPPAADQEPVEVPVVQATGTITIVKKAVPKRYDDFRFTIGGDFGSSVAKSFMLDDDNLSPMPNSKTFTDLGTGTYVITEGVHEGWRLADVTCAGARVARNGRTVSITIDAAQTVTCTFVNEKTKPVTVNVPQVQPETTTQPGLPVDEGTPTQPEGVTNVQGGASPYSLDAPGNVTRAAKEMKVLPRTS